MVYTVGGRNYGGVGGCIPLVSLYTCAVILYIPVIKVFLSVWLCADG